MDSSDPAHCEKVLRLLQASSCFDDVCASLPCACAESLAALAAPVDGVRALPGELAMIQILWKAVNNIADHYTPPSTVQPVAIARDAIKAVKALTFESEPVKAALSQGSISELKAETIPNTDAARQFPLYELAPDFTLRDRDPQADERLKLYRDIFAEITAKAIPVCDPTSDDPERVRHYTLPVGPLHRAAGKLGFQLFNGEQYLSDAINEIARLKASQGSISDQESDGDADKVSSESTVGNRSSEDAVSASPRGAVVAGIRPGPSDTSCLVEDKQEPSLRSVAADWFKLRLSQQREIAASLDLPPQGKSDQLGWGIHVLKTAKETGQLERVLETVSAFIKGDGR